MSGTDRARRVPRTTTQVPCSIDGIELVHYQITTLDVTVDDQLKPWLHVKQNSFEIILKSFQRFISRVTVVT